MIIVSYNYFVYKVGATLLSFKLFVVKETYMSSKPTSTTAKTTTETTRTTSPATAINDNTAETTIDSNQREINNLKNQILGTSADALVLSFRVFSLFPFNFYG